MNSRGIFYKIILKKFCKFTKYYYLCTRKVNKTDYDKEGYHTKDLGTAAEGESRKQLYDM
jgi:hypothetical protein